MLAGGWMSQFLSLWVSACGLSTEGNSGFLTVGWLASHSECPKEKEQGGSCVLLLSILCHVLVPGLCLAYDRCPRNIFEMREKKKKYIYIYIFYKIYRRIFLEKEVATHSSILAWRIPWTEEPHGLQSMGSQRVGHDWVTNTHTDVEELIV